MSETRFPLPVFFMLVLFFLSILPVSGQEKLIYTWSECVTAAMRNNAELLSYREGVVQKKAQYGITRSSILPQISAGVSGEKNLKKNSSESTSEKNYSYSLQAKQLLFDGFKSRYDLKGADADIKESENSYLVMSVSVRFELRKAFVTLYKNQSMLEIREEILKRRKHVMELVKMKYNAGTEHRGSYYSSRADYVQAEADLKSARRDLNLARVSLFSLMGKENPPEYSVKGDFGPKGSYKKKPDFGVLVLKHPSMVKYRYAVKSAEYAMESAKLSFSPKLYGNASVGRSGEKLDNMTETWSLGFEITAPLFEGGETWYGYKKAESVYRQALQDEKNGRAGLLTAMEEAWNTLMDSIDDVEVKKASLLAAQERSRIGEKQYSIGTLTFDNWTIIESNLVSAEKSYLESSAAALTAEAQWIQSTGGTLDYEIR